MTSPCASELPGAAPTTPPAQPEPDPAAPAGPPRSRAARLLRGPVGDPSWARPALIALLALTALLYLWQLGASGYANDFYAAAVQSGTVSWKAMFFGSLDGGNAITVDKPAFFLWPMGVSGRIFGFTSWSMLVPQALEGVAAVGLLAAAVRRVSGPTAGLAAGAILALTPVATLMFKFNNPDAMLVLLLTGASYAFVRALQTPTGTRWITLAGVLIGLGFITKMGQALLILPAFGLAYLWAAPATVGRRITDLLGATVAMVASAGWYVATVELWPAASRPYIGGSKNNSLLQLAFGYNGIGRLLGQNGGKDAVAGGLPSPSDPGFGGPTGLNRMFTGDFATEISWLLPAALLALVVGLWLTRRAPRTDLNRAALLLFGGSLLSTGLVFSFMKGTIHSYYTLALAPLIAAVLAVTGRLLWSARRTWTARLTAAVLLAVTVGWDAHLLGLSPKLVPALPALVLVGGALGCLALLAAPWLRQAALPGLVLACLVGLTGSAGYALETTGKSHTGGSPSAGPVTSTQGGGHGDRRHEGDYPGGGPPGGNFPGGGMGQFTVSPAVTALLRATTTRWAAATRGSQSSAPLQLASGRPVMSIGGFSGGDPSPTLAQFRAYVRSGQVRYFIVAAEAGNREHGKAKAPSHLTTWVTQHYTARTVGTFTVYDLATPTS